jgi:hypothetical protein
MKCVSTEEGKEILQEIHEGVCGNHAASRTETKVKDDFFEEKKRINFLLRKRQNERRLPETK